MNRVFQCFSEFSGRVVAAYRCYLSQANAHAAAQARYIREADFVLNWMEAFSILLFQAIQATAELTHILPPDCSTDLCIERPAKTTKNGTIVLRFAAWRRPGFEVDVRNIGRILNTELRRLCLYRGIPRVVLTVQMRDDNRILFAMAFENSLIQNRMMQGEKNHAAGIEI